MSISQPSREVYVVDVPTPRNFSAEFKYNFFVTDESSVDSGGIPSAVLVRPAAELDAAFVQYASTRVPRFVVINFSLSHLSDVGNSVSDISVRKNVFSSGAQNGSLIRDNYDKVVTEDLFAADSYVAVGFHDGEIQDKVYALVSGSYRLATLDNPTGDQESSHKMAMRVNAATPSHIKPHFLSKATKNTNANGLKLFDGDDEITDQYFDELGKVVTNVQINSKFFDDIIKRAIIAPENLLASDTQPLQNYSKKMQGLALGRYTGPISENDYKTLVPYIDVRVLKIAPQHTPEAEIVGYVIDKMEIQSDGSTQAFPPIIVDNPKSSQTVDLRVKYGSTYSYAVRTIAQFTLTAVDADYGDVATIKVLVSSRPSHKVYVETTEDIAPPPPSDLNFTWDYERINPSTAEHDPTTGQALPGTGTPGSLLVHWTFPPNSQRDIKKFQVFRRRSINEPFELIKMFDFDDADIKYPNLELPDPRLVETLSSPCSFLFDDDFERNSRFIYSLAAIDAHGFTSNYSAQFEVWFDIFKNRLEKRLISHAGAPKPYPNLYLEQELFTDTIRVAGSNSRRCKIYFNPEFYTLYDDDGRVIPVIASKQRGGSYRLQFINLENQKSAIVNINIDDRTAPLRRLNIKNIPTGLQLNTSLLSDLPK